MRESLTAAPHIILYGSLQEPLGNLPRINATMQEPLGRRDPEHSPLCAAFRQPGVSSVAVVGNGPLDEAQRKEIDTFDVVVRWAPLCMHLTFHVSLSLHVCGYRWNAPHAVWSWMGAERYQNASFC